jgi:MinD-like ATPase involved in chromosome partitioning or flagellar assembly
MEESFLTERMLDFILRFNYFVFMVMLLPNTFTKKYKTLKHLATLHDPEKSNTKVVNRYTGTGVPTKTIPSVCHISSMPKQFEFI